MQNTSPPPPSLLPHILAAAQLLADACDPIRFARCARTRHTQVQRCLARIARPLRSLAARLHRGLVSGPLSDQAAYTAFALSCLRRFESDLLSLFRSLNNRARRTPALAALVEQTMEAVSLVEERDRALMANALCCA
jgi:hypothetical protein